MRLRKAMEIPGQHTNLDQNKPKLSSRYITRVQGSPMRSKFVSMDFVFSSSEAVVAFAVVLFLSFCISLRWGSAKLKSPPEVKGGWPVIGHLLMLGGSEPPHKALGAMADKYGPIFTIRLGVYRAVVVSNSAMAKECFTLNDAALFGRPQALATKNLAYDFALFAFTNNAPYWREVRKITTSELFSNRRIELHKHIRIREVDTWIAELLDNWSAEKAKDSSEKVKVELKESFGNLTFNLILKILVGKRYFGSRKEGNGEEAMRFSNAQKRFFHYMGMIMVSDVIPFLEKFDFGGHQKGMKKVAEEMDGVLEEWLEEHKRRRVSGVSDDDKDFMDIMLSTLDGEDLHGYSQDTVVKSTILGLIAAANDTTTITLTWAMSLLLNNPVTLKNVIRELDEEIGRERVVNESDSGKLVYLRAVVKETLRLYPPGPLAGTRELIDDCVVGGFHISKGTRLIPNYWKIQADHRVWPEPMEFKPERFLTTHKNVEARGNHYELIPFGSGRRVCPGIDLSLKMIPFILARLLQAFDVEIPSDKPFDMSENCDFTNKKTTPLEVLISPRLSADIFNSL